MPKDRLYVLFDTILRRSQSNNAQNSNINPSANLVSKRHKNRLRNWVKEVAEVEEYLNVVTAMVNPDQFDAGKTALQQLRMADNTKDVANIWTSIFSGIGLIVNRRTPTHVDRSGTAEVYDLLLGLGSYDTAWLELEDFGMRLKYGPGTGIFLCANVLKHAVHSWEGGDRICQVQFMRASVLHHLGVKTPDWCDYAYYRNMIPHVDSGS